MSLCSLCGVTKGGGQYLVTPLTDNLFGGDYSASKPKVKQKSGVTGVDLHEKVLTDCNRQPTESLQISRL